MAQLMKHRPDLKPAGIDSPPQTAGDETSQEETKEKPQREEKSSSCQKQPFPEPSTSTEEGSSTKPRTESTTTFESELSARDSLASVSLPGTPLPNGE